MGRLNKEVVESMEKNMAEIIGKKSKKSKSKK